VGTVNDRETLALAAGFADNGKFPAPPVHDHVVTVGIGHHVQIDIFDPPPTRERISACSTRRLAVPPIWKVRMVSWVPGLTNGLGREDTDGLADLNAITVRQITPVAFAHRRRTWSGRSAPANLRMGHAVHPRSLVAASSISTPLESARHR
jgi:hypothetical protein